MTPSTSVLIPTQVPEFVRNDAPNFIEFLKAYYEFLDQYNLNVTSLRDADLAADDLIIFLRQEFAARFPKAQVNDRRLVKLIRQVYNAKGTLNAVELLFRLFFNEVVTVYQPNTNMLRASDGRWEQNCSLTLEQRYGTVDLDSDIQLKIENDNGIFYLEIDRAEAISSSRTRFYYKSFRSITLIDDQTIDIVDSTGALTYRGVLVKSPSSLEIVAAGLDWKRGQAFYIPGTTNPTVAMVTSVGTNGEMTGVDIIEYGFEHTEDQTVIISPYPTKPTGASFDLTTTVTGYNPFTETYSYAYTLTLNDYVDSVTEEVYGQSDILDDTSYFLEDYVERGYTGTLEFYQKQETTTPPTTVLVDPDLTIEQWLASRATLRYVFDYEVKYTGKWTGVEGQLSNPEMRLQDSYFYQLFSYVIQTSRNTSEYKNALNMVHPAGLKFFGELTKTAIVTFGDLGIARTISQDIVYADDVLDAFDSDPVFFVTKELTDSIDSPTDQIVSKSVGKALSDSLTLTEATAAIVSKSVADTQLVSDSCTHDATKVVTDTSTATDALGPFSVVKAAVDSATVAETVAIDINTNIESDNEVTITDTGSSHSENTYYADDYTTDDYASFDHLLTIG